MDAATGLPSAQALRERLQGAAYLADEALATSAWLAGTLERPLLLEGDAGVGKTALASALAQVQGARLVRLQCHEGLDLAQAAYEWNYGRQLMAIRLAEASEQRLAEADLFSRSYLMERPLLQAISSEGPCVLLIDEIDRADEAFEAFLLEVLSEYQITVPELGTLRARQIPWVLLTSNGTRELSDALRRRCLYHYLDYPTLAREIAIVKAALPQADTALVEEAVQFVQRLRRKGRIGLLAPALRVNGRRWQRLGGWQTALANARLRRAWRRGTPAAQLAKRYYGPGPQGAYQKAQRRCSGSSSQP
jgi:MoxR-like ATPase